MSIVNEFKKILKTEETESPSSSKKSAKTKKPVNGRKAKTAPKEAIVKKKPEKKVNVVKNPESYKILKSPLITEKSTDLSLINKYVVKVEPETNKNEVKKAIESLYGVKVLSVNMINIPRKQRRRGRMIGWKSGFKKAIVTLREGDKIEIVSH